MIWVFVVIAAAVVFVIAAVAVGRVTAGLAHSPSRAVFDSEQSLGYVAEALPDHITAQLSYDDVRTVLRLFHDYLHAQGVATTAGEDGELSDPSVADPDEAVVYVVDRAARADITVVPEHARAVIEAQLSYFDAIGAIGGPVDGADREKP